MYITVTLTIASPYWLATIYVYYNFILYYFCVALIYCYNLTCICI